MDDFGASRQTFHLPRRGYQENQNSAVFVRQHGDAEAGRAGYTGLKFDSRARLRYYFGMKKNTKSSITLPAAELKLVTSLQSKLRAKSKVDVVRRGLRLLQEVTDRESLREAYRRASQATRASLSRELAELDQLASEGIGES
jgi:Arc/MetJ-type ribon-helix-helix transcriptional regulator